MVLDRVHAGDVLVKNYSRSISINMSVVPPRFIPKLNDYEVSWVKVDPNPTRTRYNGHLPSRGTVACSRGTCSAAHRRPRHSSCSRGPTELVGAEPIHAIDEAELTLARDCAQGDRDQLKWKDRQGSRMGDAWQTGLCWSRA
jgi:hypothetical protein